MRDAELFDQGRALVESIVHLALALPAGGDGRWDAMLAKLGVRGLEPDERVQTLREGPGQAKGPLPIELRWALEAATEPLAEQMDDRWRMRDLRDAAMRDYVNAVKPRVTTSSIFANALATSANILQGSAGTVADGCPCCGAPLADRSRNVCRYCGEPLGPKP